jgi:hypothetical protein
MSSIFRVNNNCFLKTNRLVFLTKTQAVLHEVGMEFLSDTYIYDSFQVV